MTVPMNAFTLRSGAPVARLGQGTWNMGVDRAARKAELAALRLGLDLGLAMIDTAELYGDGATEELVGEAIKGRRDEVYLVSKVVPHNATRKGTVEACKRSLKRLATDYLDLYLLHWRESEPLEETLAAFVTLEEAGLIRAYGVSNFDRDDVAEARALRGGDRIAANQVLYSLRHRGIEWELLDESRERGLPIIGYSPLGSSASARRAILGNATLRAIAARHATQPAQVALAWLLRHEHIYTIPKAASDAHVRENRGALDLELSEAELEELDRAFPPPRRKVPLQMI
jgi:diketogulonate reductase-like aldo/keto reductase